MKAREIKKKLLDDYENAILEYKQLTQFRDISIEDQRTRIKVLEHQLDELFGIDKLFVFKD